MGGWPGVGPVQKKKFESVRGGWPGRSGKMNAFITWLTKAFQDRFAVVGPRVRCTEQLPNKVAQLGDGH